MIIDELQQDPYQGSANNRDLAGVSTIDFRYNKTVYELAYYISQQQDGHILIVISGGSRENFYDDLKRYIKTSGSKLN